MQTERLCLIPFEQSDLDLFEQINTNPFVRHYLWDNQSAPTQVFAELLEEMIQHFTKDRWGLWKVTTLQKPAVMGYVGLWPFLNESQPQLLYAFLPEYTGKGYATEASRQIVSYAFEELQFSYLIAAMDRANQASAHLCERLGFQRIDEKEIEGKPILVYRLERDPIA